MLTKNHRSVMLVFFAFFFVYLGYYAFLIGLRFSCFFFFARFYSSLPKKCGASNNKKNGTPHLSSTVASVHLYFHLRWIDAVAAHSRKANQNQNQNQNNQLLVFRLAIRQSLRTAATMMCFNVHHDGKAHARGRLARVAHLMRGPYRHCQKSEENQ